MSDKRLVRNDRCSGNVAYAIPYPGKIDGTNLSSWYGGIAGLNCQENRALEGPPVVVARLANSETFWCRCVFFIGVVEVNTKLVDLRQ